MKKYLKYKNHKINLEGLGYEDSLAMDIVEDVMQITGLELVVSEMEYFLELINNHNYIDTLSLISNVAFIDIDLARTRLKTFLLIMGMCGVAISKNEETCWQIMEELADVLSGFFLLNENKFSILDILEMLKDEGINVVSVGVASSEMRVGDSTRKMKTLLLAQYPHFDELSFVGECMFNIHGICLN